MIRARRQLISAGALAMVVAVVQLAGADGEHGITLATLNTGELTGYGFAYRHWPAAGRLGYQLTFHGGLSNDSGCSRPLSWDIGFGAAALYDLFSGPVHTWRGVDSRFYLLAAADHFQTGGLCTTVAGGLRFFEAAALGFGFELILARTVALVADVGYRVDWHSVSEDFPPSSRVAFAGQLMVQFRLEPMP